MTADPATPPPRANPDLIGHQEAEAILAQAAAAGRVPHGWLISGPRGVGKATLAFRFARYLLAFGADGHQAQDAAASLYLSPDHPVFRRVASRGHGDLLTIERPFLTDDGRETRDLNVAQARRLGPFLHRTAAEGGWRVVVVDECDAMNTNSANAVLKIVEEPPPQSIILMVCEAPGGLPATIRSRCRRIALNALTDAEVDGALARMAPELSEADRPVLVGLAGGSIGRALALHRDGGAALYREVTGLLGALPGADPIAVHRLGDKVSARGADTTFDLVRDLVLGWIQRVVLTAAGDGRPGEIVPGEAAVMAAMADGRGLDRWVPVWENVRAIFARGMTANLDRKNVVLHVFAELEAATRA